MINIKNKVKCILMISFALLGTSAFAEWGGQCAVYARKLAVSILGDAYKSSMAPGLCSHAGSNSDCGARWIYDDWDFGFGKGIIPRKNSLMVLEAFDNGICGVSNGGCGHVGVVQAVNVNNDGSVALTVNESNWSGNEQISYDATYTLNKEGSHVTRGNGATLYPIRGFVYTNAGTPQFHGAGSLIRPAVACFGCNRDTDAIHGNGKSGLILFQWYYTPTQCSHIDIAVEGMSYGKSVEIRTGPWDSRASDKSYVANLPVSIETNGQSPWNVTAIKLEPFTSNIKVNATCKTTPKIGRKSAMPSSNISGIGLENGWVWQGNGSLISGIADNGFGVNRDVVKLTDSKGAAFFQWQKSPSCKNLNITAGLSGNYKLRVRGWSSSPDDNIMSRDVYLSGSLGPVLNPVELLRTFNLNYYLLSVYSDTNFSASQVNEINVSCSVF